jgi:hypothetical protein
MGLMTAEVEAAARGICRVVYRRCSPSLTPSQLEEWVDLHWRSHTASASEALRSIGMDALRPAILENDGERWRISPTTGEG